MNIYSIQYEELDSKDLRRILNESECLVLPAKKALVKRLEEYPEQEDFDSEKIKVLKQSIEEETEQIKNLEYMDWLGLGIIEKPDEIFIKRNKMAKSRDRWAIFLGILLTLNLFPAIQSWFELFSGDKFATPQAVKAVILSILGAFFGLRLLVRALDRVLSMKKFRLRKKQKRNYFKK
jgi:hypothetical protein